MIVLDTNILSEPFKPEPAPQVLGWLDAQDIRTLFLTTITLAEVRTGIAVLPDGKRKSVLEQRFEGEVVPQFNGRILPFDEPATVEFARLTARLRAAGRGIDTMDALIAAVCLSTGHALATRNVSHFKDTRIDLINPWG
ncbi:type II toxin-antitoxin system VapC family toxin [Tessaracoccus caeni]|uniref:type II toxin-antitoxin system VapC family toxin n=1 Tax=Tessaracoccus caeni TaxID=3031239 RepID=UPI0023DBC789|nr:type II toxin-antitoxin system VapC family toxin [Tessaracoccus caeni]MDF1489231.1 type II toxin-antitoxin system VapC family toxin [Tessaracoccus caeni]